MKPLRGNNPGLRFLIGFWSKYCPLKKEHVDWARCHIHVLSLRKGDVLYVEGSMQKEVYLVVKGLLARTQIGPKGRRILSIALPGMAMMTTDHLYSGTPSIGDIVVLRPKTMAIRIPYRTLRDFKDMEPRLDTLVDVLTNKKKKQVTALSLVKHETDPFDRYLVFADTMPWIRAALTQTEQAELLSIGRNTVQRAQYYLLTGKRPRY